MKHQIVEKLNATDIPRNEVMLTEEELIYIAQDWIQNNSERKSGQVFTFSYTEYNVINVIKHGLRIKTK